MLKNFENLFKMISFIKDVVDTHTYSEGLD